MAKKSAARKGTVVKQLGTLSGCDRQVRAITIKHKGGGSHVGYYVTKADRNCKPVKRGGAKKKAAKKPAKKAAKKGARKGKK